MALHADKKRITEDEVEEEMHLAFRGAANALSQVYTQAVAHQKASFVAGGRRAMGNVYRWLLRQQEQASEVPVSDVLAYLQNEIALRTDDIPAPSQHPNQPPPHYSPSAVVQSNPFSFGNVAAALNARIGETDQTRDAGISNYLPNPLRTNFQSNPLIQSSGSGLINSFPNRNESRNNHRLQNQDLMHCHSNEPSTDMHHDGP